MISWPFKKLNVLEGQGAYNYKSMSLFGVLDNERHFFLKDGKSRKSDAEQNIWNFTKFDSSRSIGAC